MAKAATVWLLVAIVTLNASVSMAAQCERAVVLKLGEVAPCTGLLLPDAMAADMSYWKEWGPKFKILFMESQEDNRLLLQPTPPAPDQWYESPIFWGVTMGLTFLAIGFGIGAGYRFGAFD